MEEETTEKTHSWLQIFKFFLSLVKGERFKFIFWTSVIFVGGFSSLIIAFLIGLIVDFFVNYTAGDPLTIFYKYCILSLAIYIVAAIARLKGKEILWGIAIHGDYNLRVKSFEKLMQFSIHWHSKENSGNRVQKIQNAAKGLGDLMFQFSNNVINIAAMLIGVLAAFIILSPEFLIFVAAYMVLFLLVEKKFNKRIEKLNDNVNKASEKATGTFFESASNILSVKSLGASKTMIEHVKKKEGHRKDYWMKIRTKVTNKWRYFQIINGLALGGFLILVGHSFIKGAITAGLILVYFSYFEKLRKSTAQITGLMIKLIEDKSAISRVIPIFDEVAVNWFGKKKFPKKWNKLRLNNITFSYKDAKGKPFKIEEFNLEVEHTKKIGIVGHSGSGKSTIAKLFMGIYPISKGSINIGKQSFYDIDYEEITDNISIILQEPELFNLSFKENITLMKTFKKEQFEKAIDIAQLRPVLKKLPDSVETLIGEKGYKLSGGERQRVGIARAIYKDTPIIILDEATSALDGETEQKIQDALEKKLQKKTMFIIAHRLSTLRHVDELLFFSKGRLVEQGSFSQLVKKKDGHFKKLWQAQQKK